MSYKWVAPEFETKVWNCEDSAPPEDLDGAGPVRDVRAGSDHRAADAVRHGRGDRVGPRARDKHVAPELKQRLARAHLPRAVLDEPVTVERTKREELLGVEPLLIGEETVNRAHTDDPRPRPGAGPRRPGADLAEPLEGDGCPP